MSNYPHLQQHMPRKLPMQTTEPVRANGAPSPPPEYSQDLLEITNRRTGALMLADATQWLWVTSCFLRPTIYERGGNKGRQVWLLKGVSVQCPVQSLTIIAAAIIMH